MRLLFFGTSEFAVPSLEALAAGHEVAGVVTQPDRPAGRGHKLMPTPVKRAAERLGIPVWTPERLRSIVDDARALAPDAFVVASYGKIVPQALLEVVPIAFNIHPSLLPLYRGATPIQSAIRDGRDETAITIIAMDAGMDTGDILGQQRYEIGADETYGELHDRLAQAAVPNIVSALMLYQHGSFSRTPQAERARNLGITDAEIAGTLTRPLRKDDLVIDRDSAPKRIVDLVRSLSPRPAARTELCGETVKVLRAHAEAGGVVFDVVIAPGRRPMSGDEFARSRLQQHR